MQPQVWMGNMAVGDICHTSSQSPLREQGKTVRPGLRHGLRVMFFYRGIL